MHLTSLRPITRLIFLAVAAGTVACATEEMVKTVQTDMGIVRGELRSLSLQVGSLDSLMKAQAEEGKRRWAELSTDEGDVKQRLGQVQAKLDEAARRLADLAKGLESVRLYGGSRQATPSRGSQSRVSRVDTFAGTPSPEFVSDVRGLYDLASEDMKSGNYSLAISEFSQLLENFPKSDLSDNAGYWLGECHYAQKNFSKAIKAFQRVITDYPDGDKVPAAMLKLGYARLALNHRTKGIRQLRNLIKQFPESDEADLARQRLKAVKRR